MGIDSFFLAGITDYWDGFLARKYNLESIFGEILDPIADNVVTFLVIGLSIELSSIYIGMLGGTILVREFWVGALRDFNSRNGTVGATKVTLLAKMKTSIQFFTFLSYLIGLYLNNSMILFIANFFLLLALIITLKTGFSYTLATFKK